MKNNKNNKLSIYFLFSIILLFGIAVFKIFLPFLATLVTAFVFWQLFDPVYQAIVKKIKSGSLASLVTCVLVFLVIILPFFIVGSIVTGESLDIYKNITEETNILIDIEGNAVSTLYNYSQKIGIPQEKVQRSLASIDIRDTVERATGITVNLLQQAYQGISQFVFLVFVMLFALYYLFLDGERFIKYIFHLSPLGKRDESLIWNRFISMSRATIKGILIIGIIQGIVGWATFWILGISSPAFWGVVIGIFSVIPFLGLIAIWLPAAVWFLIAGSWIKALVLILVGSLVIGSIDNFLKPKLIGKNTSLHPVLILVGTFGGILEFGILGFIIGPLLLTIFVALLEIFERKFHKELNNPS